MTLQEEYIKILTELLQATKGGELNWKKQNPTTVFLETTSNSEKAIISLQKVVTRGGLVRNMTGGLTRKESQTNFVFMVKRSPNNELVLQIDTNTEESLKPLLSDLFDACELNTEKKNMEFLNGIINNLGKTK